MRKFIIDTDTATDDVVAIIAALRAKNIEVCALTVVAGNVELKQAVKNALIAVQVANTYRPPVYIGMAEPLCRKLVKAENVHGEDGMGNEVFDLADPTAMAATIWPDIVEQTEEVYVTVETDNEENYGQMFYSIKKKNGELYNATICLKIHREKYRKHMIDVIFNDGYLE